MKDRVPSSVPVKLQSGTACITDMLTELSIRGCGCFAILMSRGLLMVMIHALSSVSIPLSVMITSLVKAYTAAYAFSHASFGALKWVLVLQRLF